MATPSLATEMDQPQSLREYRVNPPACWPDYCATYMMSTHNGVTVYEARNILQSGEENRQICFNADSENTRICRFSTGLTIQQTYATNQWVTTLTISTTFDGPPPPSKGTQVDPAAGRMY